MRTGVANLPLHYGKAPRWLFQRTVQLARQVAIIIVEEKGPEEMLRRMADPFWFQAFGCVLGFDWHSSGVTTTVCGALKEGIKGLEKGLGLFVAGGKGKTSRQTPAQITAFGEAISLDAEPLVYASRMSAKVDSAAVQDGYQLYHHVFLFTAGGSWAVVQPGMNESTRYARRYHWLGEGVNDFVCEPHSAVCCDSTGEPLNLVAAESTDARTTIAQMVSEEKPEKLLLDLKRLKSLSLPPRHDIRLDDINPDRLDKIFLSTYERQPGNYEALLGMPGVGAKTLRALSLLSEIAYGVPASFRDPARFSFAHGGKDGYPYPVDRDTYDRSIDLLRKAVRQARIENSGRQEAERRLAAIENPL